MKKMRGICILICMLLMCGMFGGCSEPEKEVITASGQMARVDKSIFLDQADIILKGEVIEVQQPYFTNPDAEQYGSNGVDPVNAYTTVYTLRVDEVYQGEWTEDTIEVKIYNRIFMTVEQALYGEDENAIVVNDIPDVEMQPGECVVGLSYFDEATYGEAPCYNLLFGAAGYFLPEEDGSYINQSSDSNNIFTFTLDELESLN